MLIESSNFLVPLAGYLPVAEVDALATAELTSALLFTALFDALEITLDTALAFDFAVSFSTQLRSLPAPTAVSTLNSAVRPSAMVAYSTVRGLADGRVVSSVTGAVYVRGLRTQALALESGPGGLRRGFA